eukprot:762760-Hanusia_phi.AAC.12
MSRVGAYRSIPNHLDGPPAGQVSVAGEQVKDSSRASKQEHRWLFCLRNSRIRCCTLLVHSLLPGSIRSHEAFTAASSTELP